MAREQPRFRRWRRLREQSRRSSAEIGASPKRHANVRIRAEPGVSAGSAPSRDRTCDQVLRRHLLYPLSYRGLAGLTAHQGTGTPLGMAGNLLRGTGQIRPLRPAHAGLASFRSEFAMQKLPNFADRTVPLTP